MVAASRRLCFLMTSIVACGVAAGQSSTLEDDWLALVALYESTDGDNWTNNLNWSTSMAAPPTALELSTWYGGKRPVNPVLIG